ncbi:kinase-like domain-containing protein, partial [Catenaria anguillulae PL171]
VVLGDLGEARVLSNSSSVASSMVGSPAYWSPELCVGAKYHRAADVWALGIVLYESATLTRPFQGHSLVTLMQSIVHDRLTFP